MTRHLAGPATLAVVSLLGALAVGPAAAQVPARAYAALPVPAQTFDNPDAVVAHYIAGFGVERPAARAIERPGTPGADLALVFSVEGLPGRSLAGQEWRVALDNLGVGYRVTEAGVRYRCWRVEPGQWRKTPCP